MKNLFASAAIFALVAGFSAPAAFAEEDQIVNKVSAGVTQSITMDDQWNIGGQWADTNDAYGVINQRLDQLNAGGVVDVSVETSLKDCDCFDDVSNDVSATISQGVNMHEQINGGLQVALTEANIGQTMDQLNVGGAVSVGSSINIPAVAP